ncbi:flippase [Desulfobacterales bacterium HSG16]|nr:flippase [Desulfobacterales bacterium HSG16]
MKTLSKKEPMAVDKKKKKPVPVKGIGRNSVLNLIGYGLPLIVAVFAIPLLVKGLGTDRFGILTLAWVLIGYLSMFDMGLSRALTKMVAEKHGENKDDSLKEICGLIWTAVVLMAGFAICVAVISSFFLPFLVERILSIPDHLKSETLISFYLLVWSLPIVIPSIGIRGVLDAFGRFDLSNAVRIPLGIYTFASPLLVLPFSQSLAPVIAVLVAGRITACIAQILFCIKIVPGIIRTHNFRKDMAGRLLRFGGWMTITNMISPVMNFFDRFMIGSIVSLTAVAYYATPSEVVTKIWLFPIAILGVLFPAFSAGFAIDPEHALNLFVKGIKYIFLSLFPVTIAIILFSKQGLSFWLGSDFAENSTSIMQILAAGVFIHSIGQVSFALIQGIGRPDLTAKLNMIELPVYVAVMWTMTVYAGILGTAIAWTLRIMIETAIMTILALKLLGTGVHQHVFRKPSYIMAAALIFFLAASLVNGIVIKTIFFIALICAYIPLTWYKILTSDEKKFVIDNTLTLYKKRMKKNEP